MATKSPEPQQIKLLQKSKQLEVQFDNGEIFQYTCEYLRVHSPSAEVKGHGGNEPPPVTGKQDVNITSLNPVGNYAVKIHFNDGHDSGLFSWDLLYRLGCDYEKNWQRYLERVAAQRDNSQPAG